MQGKLAGFRDATWSFKTKSQSASGEGTVGLRGLLLERAPEIQKCLTHSHLCYLLA